MIKRYSRPEMSAVWTEENKFNAYLKVEIEAAAAWCQVGVIPEKEIALLRQNASFNIDRIYELEKETRHDIVAFTRAISETLGDEKKWVHYGLTSTDVVDTANGYLLKQANTILRSDLQHMAAILKKRAYEFKNTPCIGRTHGVHADITALGLKWALWFDEMQRNIARFEDAAADVECGKVSGAVGNFANAPAFVQDYVCQQLGIHSAHISTQTLQRDRHAHYMSILALIGATIEKMATEVRHWQRTELREAEESFGKGQKGSSAMPHKRNPIGSENMCGCARVLRGYMITAYEDIALWHERDI
ncbi:MAG: adenylosuccinate lyase, partial [Bacteroidales bacterium]